MPSSAVATATHTFRRFIRTACKDDCSVLSHAAWSMGKYRCTSPMPLARAGGLWATDMAITASHVLEGESDSQTSQTLDRTRFISKGVTGSENSAKLLSTPPRRFQNDET